MASLSELVLIVGALIAVLGSLALVMYIIYRIGLYVALNFIVQKPAAPSEQSD